MSDRIDDAAPDDEQLYKVLLRVGATLDIAVRRSDLQSLAVSGDDAKNDPLRLLIASADHAGIFLRETVFASASETTGFVRKGYPVVIATADGEFVVLEKLVGRKIEASGIRESTTSLTLTSRDIARLLFATPAPRCFVCKKELECDALSAADPHGHSNGHGHDDHHEHPTPLRRFIELLNLDRHDIATIMLFAFVAGVLALATPLAIESLVNVVSWGTYLQPLIVLGLMLLTCLSLAGVLKVLQAVVVEIIQRRQFVRIVSDLAHRFPRAQQASLMGLYPREFANRVFDIMTIQKATAVLLLDGVTILLTTLLGLVLLAFYHPFLLGFDIVLVISMVSITWVLGRGGIRTAIEESLTKYRVAHWLQDVISSPTVFKTGGGEELAVHRANQLTADYVAARQRQFRVVIRQIAFAIGLQVVASTAVLALGGWLVIDGQLTLGQLVASELVVTVVVGAFAKAGKSLEKFYDLMAGVDKVGHLIDLPVDPRPDWNELPVGPAEVQWGDLSYHALASSSTIPGATIEAGDRIAISGDDVDGRSLLARTLVGLAAPTSGLVQIAGFDSAHIPNAGSERLVAYAGKNDVFHGTLRENIDLGRGGIGQNQVRDVMQKVGLSDLLLHLPDGLQTQLQTQGHPLSELQARLLTLARAMLVTPRLLVVDGLLDELPETDRMQVWNHLADASTPWTLIINTNRPDVAGLCKRQISIERHG